MTSAKAPPLSPAIQRLVDNHLALMKRVGPVPPSKEEQEIERLVHNHLAMTRRYPDTWAAESEHVRRAAEQHRSGCWQSRAAS